MPIIKRETDYALRALTRLALSGDFLPVSALAEAEDVPADFLRKIMQRLHQAGVVESCQGPFGGYRLARATEQITVLDIVEAVQGPLVMSECISTPKTCSRSGSCPLRKHLGALEGWLNAKLTGVHISDAVGESQAGQGAGK